MKRITTLVLAAGIAAAAALAAPTAAHAEETTCRGGLGAVTVDNLRVPQGATCTLNGTRVKGTLKVENYATLKATRINVIGNVQAENARSVQISSSTINQAVQIVQGGGASLTGNKIGGTLLYDDNNLRLVANNNTIDGDLQAFQNTGGVQLRSNRIDGNLQCKENRPAPTGGGNIVQGNKEDQCARL